MVLIHLKDQLHIKPNSDKLSQTMPLQLKLTPRHTRTTDLLNYREPITVAFLRRLSLLRLRLQEEEEVLQGYLRTLLRLSEDI